MSAKKRVKLEIDGDAVYVDMNHPVFEDAENGNGNGNDNDHENDNDELPHSESQVGLKVHKDNNDNNGNVDTRQAPQLSNTVASNGLAADMNTNIPSSANGNDADFEREKMRLLLSNFNEDQMARYEAYRRANINRSSIKKLANSVLNQSITGNVAVALSGMSKVFVGEIVEKARNVQMRMDQGTPTAEDSNAERPITPSHLREAWRLYKQESGTVPAAHWRRQGAADGTLFR